MLKHKKINYNDKEWSDFLIIYNETFKEYERAPIDDIKDNIDQKINNLYIVTENDTTVGFYILANSERKNFNLLWYIGISQDAQGQGLGSKILKGMINNFKNNSNMPRLLLEAEKKQALWYSKMGFLKIDYDYKYPSFNSNEMTSTSLMSIEKDNNKIIQKKVLREIVSELYSDMYGLNIEDKRHLNTIKDIKKDYNLVNYNPSNKYKLRK